jgi:hypothetical protein
MLIINRHISRAHSLEQVSRFRLEMASWRLGRGRVSGIWSSERVNTRGRLLLLSKGRRSNHEDCDGCVLMTGHDA